MFVQRNGELLLCSVPASPCSPSTVGGVFLPMFPPSMELVTIGVGQTFLLAHNSFKPSIIEQVEEFFPKCMVHFMCSSPGAQNFLCQAQFNYELNFPSAHSWETPLGILCQTAWRRKAWASTDSLNSGFPSPSVRLITSQ